MDRFTGRVAIVTGGARGMGRAATERFLEEGGSVVIADIDGDEVRRAVTELEAGAPGRIAGRAADVAREADVRAVVEEAVRRFGRLDIMVAHAGIAIVEPFMDHDLATFESTLSVNLSCAFLCIREAARQMIAQGSGGSIVVTGSTNAFWVETNSAAYNASKGGVVALVRSAALDLARHGIRVNSIAPGLIRTRLTTFVHGVPEHAREYLGRIPLGRFGEPSDVARLIAFLASDDAAWITGIDVPIDGGQTLGGALPLPPDA